MIVDGDLCVATLDDAVVLSTRLYDRPAGRVGAFVGEGSVVVTEFTVHSPLTDAEDSASVTAELIAAPHDHPKPTSIPVPHPPATQSMEITQ